MIRGVTGTGGFSYASKITSNVNYCKTESSNIKLLTLLVLISAFFMDTVQKYLCFHVFDMTSSVNFSTWQSLMVLNYLP